MNELKANVTAYVGHNYGDAEWTASDVLANVTVEAAAHDVEGFTLAECVGYWINPQTGDVEIEHSTRLDMLNVSMEAAKNMLQCLTVDLMQWSIIYEVRTLNGTTTGETANDPTEARAAVTLEYSAAIPAA